MKGRCYTEFIKKKAGGNNHERKYYEMLYKLRRGTG